MNIATTRMVNRCANLLLSSLSLSHTHTHTHTHTGTQETAVSSMGSQVSSLQQQLDSSQLATETEKAQSDSLREKLTSQVAIATAGSCYCRRVEIDAASCFQAYAHRNAWQCEAKILACGPCVAHIAMDTDMSLLYV